jgi:hypothetical protein
MKIKVHHIPGIQALVSECHHGEQQKQRITQVIVPDSLYIGKHSSHSLTTNPESI